ncbi:hypothetical protein [Gallibacterium anatis]|uniref:hypothetical protein n=1 Tax=Gallibacterium anatis TaxID=750 RepID=UPI00068E424B|nr:hypothetical protein [Gallibacterium anatis]
MNIYQNLVSEFGQIHQRDGRRKTAKEIVEKNYLDDISDDPEAALSSDIAVYQEQAIASQALQYFSEWLETPEEDLEEGEGYGDRLFAMVVGVADDNKNGEIDDDEADIANIAQNAIYDYLVSKGVSNENAVSLLEEFDNDLAETVRNFLLEKLPEGDDALNDEFDKVVFSADENESIFDSTDEDEVKKFYLDAAYRKRFAIRNGRKVRVNKRVSGVVRLTAKQKQALRKAQRKANSSAAKMRRIKSFKIRRRMGF